MAADGEIVKSSKKDKKDKSKRKAKPEVLSDTKEAMVNVPEPTTADQEPSAVPKSGTLDKSSRKRKREALPDELEIDVSLPEPPSKKALRRAKKGKPNPAPTSAPKDQAVWWDLIKENGHYSELTPLHIAVLNDDMALVKILVDGHACLEIFDNSNRTPYDIARERNNDEIKTYLMQAMTDEGISEEMQRHLDDDGSNEEDQEQLMDPLGVI